MTILVQSPPLTPEEELDELEDLYWSEVSP